LKSNKRKKRNLWLAVAAVLILAGIAWISLRSTSEPADDSAAVVDSDGVLSPALFADQKARAAYQTARDIPEVLSQLPCFCGCMMERGHKNNLFCFKDQHGSICEICEDIALDARKMHDEGLSIARIRDNIVAKYARYQP
jgi:Protein of unknown function with PCYCGC motif